MTSDNGIIKKITLVLTTLFCVVAFAQELPQKPQMMPSVTVRSPLSSAFVFPAGYAAYNARAGYRKFDGIDEYERVDYNGFFTFGGAAGMRFQIKRKPRFRFQPMIEIGWGTCDEEVFEDMLLHNDGRTSDAYQRMKFLTFGGSMDVHALFPTDDINRMLYLSAGTGLHTNTFHDTWETKSGIEVTKTNDMRTVTYSLNVGGGIEYRINRQRAVAFGYNFRFWNPIYYTDFGDMFPMGVKYTEYFYSHMFQVHILLPKSQAVGFR